jgi:hypothetical protein
MNRSAGRFNEIVIKRKALLDFYDRRPNNKKHVSSPVSAITGLLGEECVLQLLRRRLRGAILDFPCKTKGRKGPRLDGWIKAGRSLYQVEVKNWCAHSMGGESFPEEPRMQLEHSCANLTVFLTHLPNIKKIWKVLAPMDRRKLPTQRRPTPLLAFWAPVALPTSKKLRPLFKCPLAPYRKCFRKAGYKPPPGVDAVWIFSASIYLRGLRARRIRLPMPNTASRLKVLTELIEME